MPRHPVHSLPNARTLTVIAQDPAVRVAGKILTTELTIPAEELLKGPCGYRVNVIDYDSSTDTLYEPAVFERLPDGHVKDPFALSERAKKSGRRPKGYDQRLLTDPRFHAQNVYAIIMRTSGAVRVRARPPRSLGLGRPSDSCRPARVLGCERVLLQGRPGDILRLLQGCRRKAGLHLPVA